MLTLEQILQVYTNNIKNSLHRSKIETLFMMRQLEATLFGMSLRYIIHKKFSYYLPLNKLCKNLLYFLLKTTDEIQKRIIDYLAPFEKIYYWYEERSTGHLATINVPRMHKILFRLDQYQLNQLEIMFIDIDVCLYLKIIKIIRDVLIIKYGEFINLEDKYDIVEIVSEITENDNIDKLEEKIAKMLQINKSALMMVKMRIIKCLQRIRGRLQK